MAAPRVLKYHVKIYPTFYEKSFKKETLKPTPFLLSLFRYLQKKKLQISVQIAFGDHKF